MAKGAGSGDGKGGVKEYACGNKGCHICVLIFGVVTFVIGIILLIVSIGSINNNNHKSDASLACSTFTWTDGGSTTSCTCYSGDTEKLRDETCCTDPVDCDDFVAQYFAGWTMLVVGLIVMLVGVCGVCMCCCFGKEGAGAPPVALAGAPSVAECK